MTRRSFFKITGVLGLSGLLSFGPGQARQKQVSKTQAGGVAESDAAPTENTSGASLAGKEVATPGEKARLNDSDELGESKTDTNAPTAPTPPAPLALAKSGKPSPLEKAYLDAFGILKQDNSCSSFFGGLAAIEVLNELTRQIKPTYLDRSVALRMSGVTSSGTSLKYGLSYRLFEKAELNLIGPFYAAQVFGSQAPVPRIGIFQPNSRAARVTILLHELGHLIRRPDKQWLLPNDGNDLHLSRQNTMQVIAVCGDEIKSLGKTKSVQPTLAAQSTGEHDAKGEPNNAFTPGF
jgi:hypothetical protein